jgi:hypothetical protein
MRPRIREIRNFGKTRCRLAAEEESEELPKEKEMIRLVSERKSKFLEDED